MSNHQIPTKAGQRKEKKKQISAEHLDYSKLTPTWRFRYFDIESKWGLYSLFGGFVFKYDESLISAVMDDDDNLLNKVLDDCDGKRYSGVDSFFKIISNKYKQPLSLNVLLCLCKQIKETFFSSDVFPSLRDYESMCWGDIERAQHGKDGKSKNHPVGVLNLSKEAQDRLQILGIYNEELYSLRLKGKVRVYGIRELNVLEIIWVDLEHQIYPTDND